MKFPISNFKHLISHYWKLVVLEIGSIGNSLRSRREGYTVIELLAVITILVILTGIISGILTSTLRGANKTKISLDVVQNGNYAISVISQILASSRGATKVNGADIIDCTTPRTGTSLTVKSIDGDEITFACSGINISSNSASLINTNQVQLKSGSCSFTCQQKSQDAYSIPIISVQFTIEDKNAALFESKSSSPFKTSVSLRNYSP